LKKERLVKRVISNVQDFDMENLFHPNNLLEEMEEVSKGPWDAQPRPTLREKPYGQQPLLIKPKYKGDFLDKLRELEQGKEVDFYAADSENLKDFSDPEEMLKHQEHPYPRVVLDDFYEVAKPGEGAGGDDLKQYWDRGWSENESPEISEDQWLRMWVKPTAAPGDTKMARSVLASYMTDMINQETGLKSSNVVAAYLLQRFPMEALLNFGNVRIAKLLGDFQQSLIHGKKHLNSNGVTARLVRAEPRVGRWTFATSSPTSKKEHTTIFQFIPHGTTRDPKKLHVRVSCSCPSWLFWGAQYHAALENYLYGKIRPVFAPPRKRDKEGTFLVCKHVLACIPLVSRYKLSEIPDEIRERIKRAPKFRVEDTGEIIHIPKDLSGVGKRPKIKKLIKEWEENPRTRKKLLSGINDPEEVAFIAFRFPSTATALAAERLQQLAAKPNLQKKALKFLSKIEKESGSETIKEVAIPTTLKSFDANTKFQNQIRGLEKKSQLAQKRFVTGQKSPDAVAYIAHKFNHNHEILSLAIERLHDLTRTVRGQKDKEKATQWLKTILGG